VRGSDSDVAAVLERFDAEMRADPPASVAQHIERMDGIVRTIGRYNAILFDALAEADVDRVVAEQAAYFAKLGEDLEWKRYAHDPPLTFDTSLAAHGFVAEDVETLLALDLSSDVVIEPEPGVVVRPVLTADDVATYLDVTCAAFGSAPPWPAEKFVAEVLATASETYAFVAFVDGIPSAAGRVQLSRERSFASMWGGGTAPNARSRGVYRTLVSKRARLAREHGYAYLTVDARDTSRPILERLGFRALTTIHAWTLHVER